MKRLQRNLPINSEPKRYGARETQLHWRALGTPIPRSDGQQLPLHSHGVQERVSQQRVAWFPGLKQASRLLTLALACLFVQLAPFGAHAQQTEEGVVQEQRFVNINQADVPELAELLNGVGQARAEAIVRYREQFGPFETAEELAEVQGIGMATVERNRAVIRLR
ncbi:MAG: ComEA family DNA-binding protein [Pseudomonadota bacterium]